VRCELLAESKRPVGDESVCVAVGLIRGVPCKFFNRSSGLAVEPHLRDGTREAGEQSSEAINPVCWRELC